jgi:hypothetical protein
MKSPIKRIKDSRGVSLLEVLLSLVIMGFVTTAIFQLYIRQHKNFMIQDDVTNIQQNVRAAIDELGRQIRMAGYGLPQGVPALVASNTNPDTITITYLGTNCETFLSAPMPQPSAELKCGSDVSCFSEGQWVYIYEPDSSIGEWLEITQVQVAAGHLQHNTVVLSRRYGANSLVLALTQVKYYIDNTTDPDHPTLMVEMPGRPPQVYAEDITDLQFLYRMKNGMVLDEPDILANTREVIISVSGRSHIPDPDLLGDGDDDDDDDDGNSPYRYRTFVTSVSLRNFGG